MLKRFVIGLGLCIFALIAVPVLLIWWFSPQLPMPMPPEHPADLAHVERYFQALVEPGYPPGIAVVVRKGGREVFNEAYGMADTTTVQPMTRWLSGIEGEG